MTYRILATFGQTRRVVRVVDYRGDGRTVERSRDLTFTHKKGAEGFAAAMRVQHPDTVYEVIETAR